MSTLDNAVSIEKDYILSCATLLSEIGFPKSAFIKMVGTEYASDIFELVNDGKLVISGNIFFYPQRDKRKKRISQEAKYHFYQELTNNITTFIRSYSASYSLDFKDCKIDNSYASVFFSLRSQVTPLNDVEITAQKYHRNLGLFVSETLLRAIDKMPLNDLDTKQTYTVLGWYYGILQNKEQSKLFFEKATNIP